MQAELFTILVVTVFMIGLILVANRQLVNFDAEDKPKGLVLLVIMYVEAILNITIPVMGEKNGRYMAAYIGSVFMYIVLSNWSGLLGLSTSTSNYSVTLALALITWVLIQASSIRTNGIKGYIKGFFEPFPFFVVPNIFGTIAPLISLSLRLFGNVLSGVMIMSTVYTFTATLSGVIPVVGGFDFVGVFLAPVLHLYFDIFAGFLQAFLFISLTTIFIASELEEE